MTDYALNLVFGILSTLITGIITGVLVPAFASWLKSKTTNLKIQTVIDEMARTVKDSVANLEQTIVKDYKASGKWNADSQNEVLKAAIEDVTNNLADTTKNFIEDSGVDLYKLISTKVEAYIYSSKLSRKDDSNEGN